MKNLYVFKSFLGKISKDTIRKVFKIMSILVIASILAIINDGYLRISFYQYNNELRLLDHLMAGISIPLILYLMGITIYESGIFYLIGSTGWELYQYITRGYFQYTQYIFDIAGILVIFCVIKASILLHKRYSYQ